jgi:toxin ParE1/3/4
LADIENLLSYYDSIDPELALRIEQRIISAPDILAEHPHAGPAVGETELRKWRVRGLPLLILYRPVGAHVDVDRVLHQKQNWRRSH